MDPVSQAFTNAIWQIVKEMRYLDNAHDISLYANSISHIRQVANAYRDGTPLPPLGEPMACGDCAPCPFLSGELEVEVSVDEDGEATVDLICAECAAEQAVGAFGQAKAGPYSVKYGEPPIFFAYTFMEN